MSTTPRPPVCGNATKPRSPRRRRPSRKCCGVKTRLSRSRWVEYRCVRTWRVSSTVDQRRRRMHVRFRCHSHHVCEWKSSRPKVVGALLNCRRVSTRWASSWRVSEISRGSIRSSNMRVLRRVLTESRHGESGKRKMILDLRNLFSRRINVSSTRSRRPVNRKTLTGSARSC